jgi:DNA-binding LacI/PurR family transcriptional regulator
MASHIERRKFLATLGGAAAGWPLAARAQQDERVRRIGVLMSTAVDDPQDPARLAAFAQGLQELGWTIGRNLRIDYRWGASSPDNTRKYVAELAALAPDVMLASGTPALAAVQQIRHTIPVVFVSCGIAAFSAAPRTQASPPRLSSRQVVWRRAQRAVVDGVARPGSVHRIGMRLNRRAGTDSNSRAQHLQ